MPVLVGRRKTRQDALAAAENITSRLLDADSVQRVTPQYRSGVVMFKIAVDFSHVVDWTSGLSHFSERGRTASTRQQRIDMALEVLGLPNDTGLNAEQHDVLLVVNI